MSTFEEIREERIKKLNALKERNIDAYPARVEINSTISETLSSFDDFLSSQKEIKIAGRVLALRAHGGSVFFDFFDGSTTDIFQAYLKKDEVGEEIFTLFEDSVDIGDFVAVTGKAFLTKKSEKTVLVSGWSMLAKSLRSLPEKWHGLQDVEERYRKRYLDILLNKEMRENVYRRSVFWNAFRSWLLERGFVEVETPVLENVTGGADARPFVTHHNALDIDVYLRISAGELWQKELMVAGIPKTFEIGRIFRNEGISPEHLQDYTQLEFYEAYKDYREGMEMVKDLYRFVAEKTFGTLKFNINDFEIDLANDWEVYDYVSILEEKYGLDVLDASAEEIKEAIKKNNIKHDGSDMNKERGTDLLWKNVRKTIGGPGFLINVPVYMEPLAKKSVKDPRVVERFQIILAGSEMGKGFSELNDPIDQAERFAHQDALRASGDDEAQMNNHEFVEAMEYGMPPTFGFGVSERLFSFFSGKPVRETQIFPLLRPRE